ncbi:hypothetical protein TRIUR3_31326 [Triticum urartu]|uniref:C2H2-type domain-containing protein n=1 Tax=Triticum urartu TaxID=4572 RepID=M7YFY7_TRIUA|nr:hypothetical protein TRIUR3_31326 [Triticum urartu]
MELVLFREEGAVDDRLQQRGGAVVKRKRTKRPRHQTPPRPHRQAVQATIDEDGDATAGADDDGLAATAPTASGRRRPGRDHRAQPQQRREAEFASGQALGGHMRRHRPLHAPADRAIATTAVTAIAASTTKKEKDSTPAGINLELDLNLPAPSDEECVSHPPPPPPPSSAPPVVLGLGPFDSGKKRLMLTAASAALVASVRLRPCEGAECLLSRACCLPRRVARASDSGVRV